MLDVCMNIVDEMVGIVVDGLEGGSVVNELEGGSVLVGLEGGSVVNELEGGSVVDGLEGGSLVNELEGGSVVDVLEGGCVVNESVRVVDEMLVEHCFQPSDYEEEHGWDQYVEGSGGLEQNEYWNEDSNGLRECMFQCLDCLIEYHSLESLQEHICHLALLPHFMLDNATPVLTTPKSPSLVPSTTRISCVVSGCDSNFTRKDAMLRHLRNKHKMPKDHPNYPGNQCSNPGQFLDVLLGDEGGDHEPVSRIRTLLMKVGK